MLRTLLVCAAAALALVGGISPARAETPTNRAIKELLVEICDRQEALGGPLAARTAEFKALRRSKRVLEPRVLANPTHSTGPVAKAVGLLEAVYDDDPAMTFLFDDLLDALDNVVENNLDGSRETIEGLPPSALQERALAKVEKGELLLDGSRRADTFALRATFIHKASKRFFRSVRTRKKAEKQANKPGSRIPADLPPGRYQFLFGVDDRSTLVPAANLRLRPGEVGQFRRIFNTLVNQTSRSFKNSGCTSVVAGTPFNGTFFEVTNQITCNEGDESRTNTLIYRLVKN